MLIGLIPVFNEESNIVAFLNKLEKHLDYIVIINDGSFDKTDYLISGWIGNKKNIHYHYSKPNRGMSHALLQGFNFISSRYKNNDFSGEDSVILVDADNQHNPDEINRMLKHFKNNAADVLIAQRNFSVYPKYRILGNKLLSFIASCLTGFEFKDIECGFKIIKLSCVDKLLEHYTGFRYSCAGEVGIIASLSGYKIDNKYIIKIPYYRKGGPNFADVFINLLFYFIVFLKIKLIRKNASK